MDDEALGNCSYEKERRESHRRELGCEPFDSVETCIEVPEAGTSQLALESGTHG